jgi:hypothetical protein
MRNFQNPRDFGGSWVPPKWTDFNAARLRSFEGLAGFCKIANQLM